MGSSSVLSVSLSHLCLTPSPAPSSSSKRETSGLAAPAQVSPAQRFPTSPESSPGPEDGRIPTGPVGEPQQQQQPQQARRPRTKRSHEDRLAFREAKSLYEAGTHAAKSNLLAAVMHFRQAAAVFGEIEGQEKRVEKCLWQAGMCWAKEGVRAKKAKQRTVACEAFEQAKTLFHFIGDMDKEATALYQLGLVTRDLLSAADNIKAAAILFAEIGDEAREAMCYAELGHSFGVNDPDTGIYYLKQALLLYLKLGDMPKEAHALFSIGTLAARLPPTTDPPTPPRPQSASPRFPPGAAPPAPMLNRSFSTASMASTGSGSRKPLHPAQTAFNYISQARRLFARLALAKGQAECAYQLGKLSTRYGPKGELEAAVELFEEACGKFREAGEGVDEAWSMYRLALVMLKVRSSALAIDYLTEARKLFEEAPTDERKAEGSCLLRIGEIYAAEGEADKAKRSIEEGMRLIGNDKSRSRIARRGTVCLRRLSSAPSLTVASSPSAASPSSRAFPPSSPSRSEPNSPATSITGGGLAPVLEEDEAAAANAEEDEEEELELETPGRRASQGGDAAWWAVASTGSGPSPAADETA